MTPDALTLLPYPDKRKKLEKVLLIIISVTIIQREKNENSVWGIWIIHEVLSDDFSRRDSIAEAG